MTEALQVDAAVARALGWEVRDEFYPSDGEYAGQLVYDLSGECRGGPGQGWSPSHRMDQAWEVVEAMRARGWAVRVGNVRGNHADFVSDGDRVLNAVGDWVCRSSGSAAADTAPLAICRAALAAVGATPTPTPAPTPEQAEAP